MKARIVVALCLFSVAVCRPVFAESVEALEAITSRANSLDEFLGQPKLVEEYWSALQAYYGKDKITRADFDDILKQVRGMSRDMFGFRERLWEEIKGAPSYSIKSELKSYGRTLNHDAFKKYWDETYFPKLDQGATGLDTPAQLILALKDLEKKFEDDLKSKTKLVKADRDRARAEFYRALRDKDSVYARSLRRLLAQQITYSPLMTESYMRGDPDFLLHTLRDWRDNPRKHFGAIIGDSSTLASLVRATLPDPAELLKDETIFPKIKRVSHQGVEVERGVSAGGNYLFKPIPRRFHGIWKGLPLGECIRTECGRWASIMAKDSQLYHLERDGDYSGFVQLVPERHVATGAVIASVDFGAPVMQTKVGLRTPDGDVRFVPFHEAWTAEAYKHLPAGVTGLAIGDSLQINNAQVRALVPSSAAFDAAVVHERQPEFLELDPMVISIGLRSNRTWSVYETAMAEKNTFTLNPLVFGPALSDADIEARWATASPYERLFLVSYVGSRVETPSPVLAAFFRAKIAGAPPHEANAIGLMLYQTGHADEALDAHFKEGFGKTSVADMLQHERGPRKFIAMHIALRAPYEAATLNLLESHAATPLASYDRLGVIAAALRNPRLAPQYRQLLMRSLASRLTSLAPDARLREVRRLADAPLNGPDWKEIRLAIEKHGYVRPEGAAGALALARTGEADAHEQLRNSFTDAGALADLVANVVSHGTAADREKLGTALSSLARKLPSFARTLAAAELAASEPAKSYLRETAAVVAGAYGDLYAAVIDPLNRIPDIAGGNEALLARLKALKDSEVNRALRRRQRTLDGKAPVGPFARVLDRLRETKPGRTCRRGWRVLTHPLALIAVSIGAIWERQRLLNEADDYENQIDELTVAPLYQELYRTMRGGTYRLSPDEARGIIAALRDVESETHGDAAKKLEQTRANWRAREFLMWAEKHLYTKDYFARAPEVAKASPEMQHFYGTLRARGDDKMGFPKEAALSAMKFAAAQRDPKGAAEALLEAMHRQVRAYNTDFKSVLDDSINFPPAAYASGSAMSAHLARQEAANSAAYHFGFDSLPNRATWIEMLMASTPARVQAISKFGHELGEQTRRNTGLPAWLARHFAETHAERVTDPEKLARSVLSQYRAIAEEGVADPDQIKALIESRLKLTPEASKAPAPRAK